MIRLGKVGDIYPSLLDDGKTKTFFIIGGEEGDTFDNIEPSRALGILNYFHCYGTHLSGDLELFDVNYPMYEIDYQINLSDMKFNLFRFY